MRMHHVTDIDAPGLSLFRTLRQPEEHRRNGLFVAEGEKVVLRLFASDLTVISILLTPEWFEVHRDLIEARGKDIDVFVSPKTSLETIVGFHLHQGIMALGRIPVAASVESLFARTSSPRLLVSLDGLANAENVGVVVRNCAAFGATAVVVGETSSSPYLRRAVRNSMGTVFRMPIVHTDNLVELLGDLRVQRGVTVIAADAAPGGVPLGSSKFSGDLCVVLGSEGNGIRKEVLEMCQERVLIPMQQGVDSLNVSSASAVMLYELVRGRGGRS